MNFRQLMAIALVLPVVILFWLFVAVQILFYPYVAIVVGLLANGEWLSFHRYLYEIVGIPFGG